MSKSEGGFTIVEMLLTLALFAILIPSLTIGISTLTQLNYRVRDLTLISIVAENKIESLRSIGYNSVVVGTVDFSNELPSEINGPKSANYTISQNTGYKTIDILITYDDYKTTRSVNYKSVISETGVAQ